ncbi:MarR family transcriptional regulator [Gordonia sp. HNM0687]|uniref:MarR family transcriptional regulator n=1 Tax=Gordonia mangrovi TaxID=2665643 RepID=A0A6L7GSV2_9ACTN|nr:MarR family winged helix-turn-helix transcriptional regulator [Gordonia mangrovi]MXP21735.1 MarR family transcriptional regulator [Gordonia mangrovi]UVF80465.1 MarR family winged helix-turn-helix transcriptional regulator [Gordonia mangrovi]
MSSQSPPLGALADVILRIARSVEPHRFGIEPLTGTEAAVLHWIDDHPGTSPSATAAATSLQKSNVSTTLRSLEAKGLIERSRDPQDARLVLLSTTVRARRNISHLYAEWTRVLTEALGGDLSGIDETLATLTRVDEGLRRQS